MARSYEKESVTLNPGSEIPETGHYAPASFANYSKFMTMNYIEDREIKWHEMEIRG